MLNFLSTGNQKQVVGLALTPGIGLEAIIIDKAKNCVVNYGRKKVEYNFSTREIQDYVQFKTSLVQLMNEMGISPKTMAYLVLPNVYFNFVDLPAGIGQAEIKTALESKAEEFYLFQREEPVNGWCDVANAANGSDRRLAYSPFQKRVIEQLKEIINDVGFQLIGIESAYSATLRGLYTTGLIDDVILEDSSWTLMLINTNSYTLFQLDGKNLLECSEIPLAIKSFSMEEAYQAIVSSSEQLLSNFSSTNLFIISQTDDICAEVLKRQMQFDREIIAIDSNRYANNALMEVVNAVDFKDSKSMTLAVIGAANSKSDFGLTLNAMADDPAASQGVYFVANIMGAQTEITQSFVQKLCISVAAICVLVFGSIFAVAYFTNNSLLAQISELGKKEQALDNQIQALSQKEDKQEIDMNVIIDEVAALNVTAISFYDSIAQDIPKNVWLTQYYNKAGDQIAIRGVAENIVDIYEYYKNLRIVSPASDIKLTELRVVTDESGEKSDTAKFIASLAIDKDADRLYSFEISNTQMIKLNNEKDPNSKNEESDESNILGGPPRTNIDEPSDQMTPTE